MPCSTNWVRGPAWTRPGPTGCSSSRICGPTTGGPGGRRPQPSSGSAVPCRCTCSPTPRLGSLNLYSLHPRQYDPAEVETAKIIAAHASVVLAHTGNEQRFWHAIGTRNVIGQAQGMLMQKYRLSPENAFAVLRRYSPKPRTPNSPSSPKNSPAPGTSPTSNPTVTAVTTPQNGRPATRYPGRQTIARVTNAPPIDPKMVRSKDCRRHEDR